MTNKALLSLTIEPEDFFGLYTTPESFHRFTLSYAKVKANACLEADRIYIKHRKHYLSFVLCKIKIDCDSGEKGQNLQKTGDNKL